jgi:hypothetical protein
MKCDLATVSEIDDGFRCGMVGDLKKHYLHLGMTQSKAELLLGKGDLQAPVNCKDYYLGWCSSIAWDPYSLQLCYGKYGALKSYEIYQH